MKHYTKGFHQKISSITLFKTQMFQQQVVFDETNIKIMAEWLSDDRFISCLIRFCYVSRGPSKLVFIFWICSDICVFSHFVMLSDEKLACKENHERSLYRSWSKY